MISRIPVKRLRDFFRSQKGTSNTPETIRILSEAFLSPRKVLQTLLRWLESFHKRFKPQTSASNTFQRINAMWTFNEAQQLEKRQKLLDVLTKQFVTALWQKLILYFGPWMYVEALPMQFSNWTNACNKDSKQSRIYGFCDKLSGFWMN